MGRNVMSKDYGGYNSWPSINVDVFAPDQENKDRGWWTRYDGQFKCILDWRGSVILRAHHRPLSGEKRQATQTVKMTVKTIVALYRIFRRIALVEALPEYLELGRQIEARMDNGEQKKAIAQDLGLTVYTLEKNKREWLESWQRLILEFEAMRD